MPGEALPGTGWTNWPRRISTTTASRSSKCAGPERNQITFDKVPLAQATEYAAEDADITLRLWQRLEAADCRRGHEPGL